LNEILKKFHGQLFLIKKNKKHYFCSALMFYLVKDEHNIYHAYLDFDKSNAIVTARHCL